MFNPYRTDHYEIIVNNKHGFFSITNNYVIGCVMDFNIGHDRKEAIREYYNWIANRNFAKKIFKAGKFYNIKKGRNVNFVNGTCTVKKCSGKYYFLKNYPGNKVFQL